MKSIRERLEKTQSQIDKALDDVDALEYRLSELEKENALLRNNLAALQGIPSEIPYRTLWIVLWCMLKRVGGEHEISLLLLNNPMSSYPINIQESEARRSLILSLGEEK